MARPAPQTEIAAWLHKITQATPVETHISAVFVGATDVYKLKKSIKLPFLDFSTLAARRAMALRELALNRTAAPGIYRDVLSIRRGAGGALCFGPANAHLCSNSAGQRRGGNSPFERCPPISASAGFSAGLSRYDGYHHAQRCE